MEAEVRKKPKQETLSVGCDLSASSDNPPENKDTVSLNSDVSGGIDDLSENVEVKGGFFSNLRKSDRILGVWTPGQVEKRGLAGLLKRSASTDDLFDEESNTGADMKLSVSWENLLEAATSKANTGQRAGIFIKSPKPAPRSIAAEDPLSSMRELSGSWNSLADAAEEHEDTEAPEGGELRCRRTIKKTRRVVSFRIKKTLPKIPKLTLSLSQTSDKMPLTEENVELGELNPAQQSTVEVQSVEMAAYPSENNPLTSEPDQESDELMEWWNTVKGWTEWNETSNFQEEDEETAVEQAADRVYLAARLFVRLFNLRGASLQRRILELLSLADAADQFHKKTVSAAVGGGVASVAGSVATITGLILAPFTFGASVIVTAVGISVATAGGITSAAANITDTVHSNMDRKKVEKMIQGYQEEIKDIRECLEFVQEGMDTLHEWDFEQYSQSAAKKALNHSVKTVLKEGGRAGKALLINTEKLISTVQLLGAAGGAVRAAKVMSVTTGVMSGLFLALDVFFLAKDSHELHKGAKTEFAAKIREVCKELQGGLLELNKVKTQLQKTMDGIELEEYEEVEEEVVEIEEDLEWDPKKLAELERELDLLEEKLDKKVEEQQKKSKEAEKENLKSKEKRMKDKGDPEIKENELTKERKKREEDKVEGKLESKLEKLPDVLSVKSAKEAVKEQSQKEECESKQDEAKRRNRYRRAMALHDEWRETGDEEQGTSVESVRRQFEREAGEEEVERGKREDGEGARRDREHEHSLRGYRPRSNALRGDGLYM